MPVIASIVLGLDGIFYLGLGISMICLYHIPFLQPFVMLYPSLFKLLRVSSSSGVLSNDGSTSGYEETESLVVSPSTLVNDLGFRILGYFLILLGVFRFITALHWYNPFNLKLCVMSITNLYFKKKQGLWIYLSRIRNLCRGNRYDMQ